MATGTEGGASKRRLPLAALLGANAISLVGSMLTLLALPWFVLETTGSPAKTGLTGFFVALPGFVAGVFGGTVVDRLGFKRASIIADLVSGLGIALIPLLHATVGLAFWQLLVLVFVGSLLEIPGLTARRSLLPELAQLARQPLERVNAAYEGNQYLALLLGPPIAGLLVARFGASNVLWLDAASFAISAAVVALAIPTPAITEARQAAGRYLDALLAGLRFLRGDRLLLSLAVGLAVTNFLSSPFFAVLLPVYAKQTYGRATALGLMIAAGGGGSLLGAVVFGAIGCRLPRRATWVGGFILVPFEYWVLAATPPLAVVVGIIALTGVLSGPINPLLVTIRHERIPIALRGRVFSTFSAISQVAAPAGMALQGSLVQAFGFRASVLAIAACAQVVGLGMLLVPAFREMDRPATAGEESAER